MGNYYAAGTGLLFGFTYLFVAFVKLENLSPIPFAWFSTFVAVNALVFGTIEGITGSAALGVAGRLALGSYLVSVGYSLGHRLCGGYLRQKAGKIRSRPSGV